MKKVFGTVLLGALLASSVLADDFLARVSQGALSDKSEGVKVLSLDEMKEVKGGYRFHRDSRFDFYAGPFTSYGYVVLNNGDRTGITHGMVSSSLGYSSSGFIVAQYRYVNNRIDHYLQYFPNENSTGFTIWAWRGSRALAILDDFRRRF